MPFYLPDHRITSSSSSPYHPPSEVRMSGDGWCAQSMCTVQSESHYLQVDFGAEVVVEAIEIANVYDGIVHVTKYQVEYGSNLNQLYCVNSKESNETSSTVSSFMAVINYLSNIIAMSLFHKIF